MWTRLKRALQSEHQWASEQLSAYLDDELSQVDRRRVEAHLRGCQVCEEEYSALRWTMRLVSQSPAPRAPRSFVIAESMVEPSRPASTVYLYLRGATAAVAALLLIVLVGDVLLPHTLPAELASPVLDRQAVTVVAEAPAEAVVSKEMPAERPVEVAIEKEASKQEPLAQVAVEEEKEAAPAPMGTPMPPERVLEMSKPVAAAPAAERADTGAEAEKPMALRAPSTEQISGTFSAGAGEQAVAEQEAPAEEGLATPLPSPSASPAPRIVSLPRSPTVESEMVRAPRPTALMPQTANAEARGLRPEGAAGWRSTLRALEVSLALLMTVLITGLVLIRVRHR